MTVGVGVPYGQRPYSDLRTHTPAAMAHAMAVFVVAILGILGYTGNRSKNREKGR